MEEDSLLLQKEQSYRKEIAALTLLWVATAGFYYASLIGGDLEFIKTHMTTIFLYLLLSITSFFIFNLQFFRWFASTASTFTRGCLMVVAQALLTVATIVIFYLVDSGDNFEHHGSYNILIFLMLFVPTIVLTLTIMSLYTWMLPKTRKRCRRYTLFGSIVFGIWMVLALFYYHSKWSKGLNESKLESKHGVCEFRGSNIPWVDLLPDGAQNFWTGSQTCSALPKTYTAKIENDRVYVAGCSSTPKVTFFPNTKDFSVLEKLFSNFQVTVKDNWVTAEVDQSKGTIIPPGVEAMWVECGEDQEKQMLYHTQVPKESINSRTSRKTKSKRANHKNLAEKKPNILVVYIDAISRRHFYRKMGKTTKWLETLQSGADMDVLQFFRYHSVGFNTNQNSRAMYCGINENTEDFNNTAPNSPLCPVWRTMKESLDYNTVLVTDFCEDWPSMYMGQSRSKWADHEMIAPFCHPDYYPYSGNPFGNFKGPYSILKRCLFGEYVHKHSLNYMEKIMRTYKDSEKPYYMHAIFTEAHEGTGEVISTMDDDLSNFLERMQQEKLLDDTIVMFVSDHGLHMGINFALTGNGVLEHKLPLLNIVIPKKYNQEARDQLRANEQKLITAFEIHETLLKLPGFRADGSFKPDNLDHLVNDQRRIGAIKNHKKSLFDEISWKRTCQEAQIPEETCMCDPRSSSIEETKKSRSFLEKHST